jgi:hypothetical protein
MRPTQEQEPVPDGERPEQEFDIVEEASYNPFSCHAQLPAAFLGRWLQTTEGLIKPGTSLVQGLFFCRLDLRVIDDFIE